MRICVIGKSGQVASALAEEGRGHTLVHLGRPELDLATMTDASRLIEAAGPDVLINAAAHTAVDQAESEPELAMAINATATGLLGEITASLGIPIIHLSTDYVFDGTKPTPYSEMDEPCPVSAYGRSKLAGEVALARANRRHVTLRTAWVYAHSGKNFVRTMLRLSGQGELRVVSDQFGNPTYATDIARALLDISERMVGSPEDPSLYGTFHMSGRSDASWAGFAEAIFSAAA